MDIKNIVNDCIQKVDNIKSEKEKQKQETINQLLKLRKKTIKLIDLANKTLSKRQQQLQEINEGICQPPYTKSVGLVFTAESRLFD